MKAAEIRDKFLKFFESKGHTIVRSSSLVPANDPTLLFTNSGMVQFKDVFLGTDRRGYTRATTAQRSVRAGGKHNDLENVGYTARHHTFFEMLGNFSFGDYFKRDAIHYAWELLTKVYGLPPEKLWATVYQDDDEAYDLWANEIRIPAERIVRIGDNKGARYASDNFWQMADTGPCGPCSEIFYDHGPGVAGGPPGSPDADGDRYIEIWNLVFMQYNKDENGVLHKLPKPCVDTGMGLERLAAVLQHVHSNYEIDLFQNLIAAAARETGTKDLANNSLKVIADHVRACAFLIVDGVLPGADGRGYVLRRIMRRALRHGHKLGQTKPFLHRLVADLVIEMGDAYPELRADAQRVEQVIRGEEEQFGRTLENGMKLFERAIPATERGLSWLARERMAGHSFFEADLLEVSRFEGVFHFVDRDVLTAVYAVNSELDIHQRIYPQIHLLMAQAAEYRKAKSKRTEIDLLICSADRSAKDLLAEVLGRYVHEYQQKWPDVLIGFDVVADDSLPFAGETAFVLYDTYGFPRDLIEDLCRERCIPFDHIGFDKAMDRQREQARAAGRFKAVQGLEYTGDKTVFVGYDTLETRAKVTALYVNGTPVEKFDAGALSGMDTLIVVLDRTPFYAESGGQVGDLGEIVSATGTFIVDDTLKVLPEVFGHQGALRAGTLVVGEAATARVNVRSRSRAAGNHSATHLLHAALRTVLGPHVQQKGSLVDADKTRFDFSHDKPLTGEEIAKVEELVNAEIRRNVDVSVRQMSYDDALKAGAMALFGEKYGDEVRVVGMGEFSTELCGGTHVGRTGDIGFFKVVSEGGVAAGIRRVEAVTGEGALVHVQSRDQALGAAAAALKTSADEVNTRIVQMLDQVKTLEKEVGRLKSRLASSQGDDLASRAIDIKGVKVLAAMLEGADAKTLRETMDKLKDKLKTAAIVLAAVEGTKVSLIAGVTADATARLKAGDLVNHVAQQVGGKGGGRPDMAQAGGTDPGQLPQALASVRAWAEQRL